jgi:hypothetical protein
MSARVGAVGSAVMMMVAVPSEASARHHKHVAHHHHHLSYQAREAQALVAPQVQAVNPGSMRYFGGPKSPMWRE